MLPSSSHHGPLPTCRTVFLEILPSSFRRLSLFSPSLPVLGPKLGGEEGGLHGKA